MYTKTGQRHGRHPEAIERQRRAVAMRQEGKTLKQIGEALGVSHEAVRLWLKGTEVDGVYWTRVRQRAESKAAALGFTLDRVVRVGRTRKFDLTCGHCGHTWQQPHTCELICRGCRHGDGRTGGRPSTDERWIGRVFGDYTVIGRSATRYRHLYWDCRCACGKVQSVSAANLAAGATKGCYECGIRRREESYARGERERPRRPAATPRPAAI
jgi:hypothetical protein